MQKKDLQQAAVEKPDVFRFVSTEREKLVKEAAGHVEVLKTIRLRLKEYGLSLDRIPTWLRLAHIDLRMGIEQAWLATERLLNAEYSHKSFPQKRSSEFSNFFAELRDERDRKTTFFREDMPITVAQDLAITSEGDAVLKVHASLNGIEEETEQHLFDQARRVPLLRWHVIAYILNDTLNLPLEDCEDEVLSQSQAKAVKLRRSRSRTLAKLKQMEEYVQHRQRMENQQARLLKDFQREMQIYQKREIQQVAGAQVEAILAGAQNLDDVRFQVIRLLEEACSLLRHTQAIREKQTGSEDLNRVRVAYHKAVKDLEEEAEKLKKNRYQIAFMATMKAGKSTVINAMLGQELLPALEKVTTGRLTYVTHVEGTSFAKITTVDHRLFINYARPEDLQRYLNKYLLYDWVKSAEVYLPDPGQLDLVANVDKYRSGADKAFEKPDEGREIYPNQAMLWLKEKKITIEQPEFTELCSFINNSTVADIELEVPIKYLSARVPLDGITLVDTPGSNSAAFAEHKEITYDFIDNTNAIVFVVDFTKFDTEDEKNLFLEIHDQLGDVYPNFAEKFFIAINKIDQQDASKGKDLESKLREIRERLQKDYHFEVPDSHVVGISARQALLIRMAQHNKLNKEQRAMINEYLAGILTRADIEPFEASPEQREWARSEIIRESRIEQLESVLVEYLRKNNHKVNLLLDSLQRTRSYIHKQEQEIQQSLAFLNASLSQLEQATGGYESWVREAERKKKKIFGYLSEKKKDLEKQTKNKYEDYQKRINSTMDLIFRGKQTDKDAKLPEDWEKVSQKVSSLSGEMRQEVATVLLTEFQNDLIAAVRNHYAAFDLQLRTSLKEERNRIYRKAYRDANQILAEINQKLNTTLQARSNVDSDIDRELVFPALNLQDSLGKVKESRVTTRTEKRIVWEKKEVKIIFKFKIPVPKIATNTYYNVDLADLKRNASHGLKNLTEDQKASVQGRMKDDFHEMEAHLGEEVDGYIQELRKKLDQALKDKQSKGEVTSEQMLQLLEMGDRLEDHIIRLDNVTDYLSKPKNK